MSPSTNLEFAAFGSELTRLELHAKGNKRMMVGYASAFDFPIPGDHGETIYIRQGAFKKTLKENRENIQVLYHHGADAEIGSKPLGVPVEMREDRRGLWTETELADTAYNRETIVPLLESGALRAMSIGHIPMERRWNDERTEVEYRQILLGEYGPTPFPRNLGATAAVHAATVAELERLILPASDGRNRTEGEADSSELGGRGTTAEADRITGAVKLGRTIEEWGSSLERDADWIRTFGG